MIAGIIVIIMLMMVVCAVAVIICIKCYYRIHQFNKGLFQTKLQFTVLFITDVNICILSLIYRYYMAFMYLSFTIPFYTHSNADRERFAHYHKIHSAQGSGNSTIQRALSSETVSNVQGFAEPKPFRPCNYVWTLSLSLSLLTFSH